MKPHLRCPGAPIAGPFEQIALSFQKQAKLLRYGIFDIVIVPQDAYEYFFAHYITYRNVLQCLFSHTAFHTAVHRTAVKL